MAGTCMDGPRDARVFACRHGRPIAVMCPACCRGARPQALMGPVWDRGLIKPAGSRCPMTRDSLPSICRLTDTAITLLHPRKPCGPTGTGQVIGSCRRGMPYLVDVSLFGREGPFLRPGLGSLRRRAQPRSRIAAGDRRRRRVASLTAASTAPGSGGSGRCRSCRAPQHLLFVFAQIVHVEVAMLFEPVLVGLDREGPHQPQATLAVGEDAHDMGAAFDFLV